MIIHSSEILWNDNIWNKAKNLQIIKNAGFNTPNFIVLDWKVVSNIEINFMGNIEKLINIIKKDFIYNSYAIRSCALCEDLNESSMAGQFYSQINVKLDDIGCAIKKLIENAKTKIIDLNKLSIIIQEYTPCSASGVCFTRNPNWNREMVVEYYNWEWEELVSGKIIPKKEFFYSWENNSNLDKICDEKIINRFRNIEALFKFPMDIEWCINDNKIYFLQARNITTISKEKYREILFLENELSKNPKYYYEKNEVSEVSPRPVNLTYSLLKKIYSKNGPIDNFYKKRGIILKNIDFLKIIWNELYVDKQKELKNIFPCLWYYKKTWNNTTFSPFQRENPQDSGLTITFDTFSWFYYSLKNFLYLFLVKYNKEKLFKSLKEKLEHNIYTNNINSSINIFLTDYEIIYEINFFALKAFKKLENVIKKEKISFSQIMNLDIFEQKINDLNIDFSSFIWNSLDILDENDFYRNKPIKKNNDEVLKTWESLPKWKKNFFSPYIREAIYMQNLRELGRYLTVKNISLIREIVLNIWEEAWIDNKNIYFTELEELTKWNINENLLIKRRQEYCKFNKFNLPNRLLNKYIYNSKNNIVWISSGVVKWILVSENTINAKNWKKILLVNILSPELVKYFGEIEWIVSINWWILSHLSILAREKWIPVVSWFNENYLDIKLWDNIQIDWSIGKIIKL